MQTILNIEKSMYQIRNLLINDSIIRKLLYINTPAALSSTMTVTPAMVNSLVLLVPFVEDETGVAESSDFNFIVIYPRNTFFTSEVNTITIGVDLFVNKAFYLLDDNKMRLTQLFNRVADLLENKKLAFAEKLKLDSSTLTSIGGGSTIGFVTIWEVADGTTTTEY